MADPRKTVRVPEPEFQREVSMTVHRLLLAATAVGAKEIGATGASFVIIGVGVWARELSELDPRATAKYFRALADIFDPKKNDTQKRRAEADRAQAVRAIFTAVDLEMAEPQGNG